MVTINTGRRNSPTPVLKVIQAAREPISNLRQGNKRDSQGRENNRMNPNSPLANETVFKRMLSLERRRCERTNERFALMLVDMEELKRTMSVSAIEEIGIAIS